MDRVFGPCKIPPFDTLCDVIVIFFAELVGTSILMFLLCTGMLVDKPDKLVSALSYGLAMLATVQIFGHISFCNVNPAISVAAAILGHIHPLMFPIYLSAQVIGGITGTALYFALCPWDLYRERHCVTKLGPGVNTVQGLFFEFFLTGIYTLAYAVAFEKRLAFRHDSLAIRFGLILVILTMSGYEFTNCSINPVRSLAPAIFENYWDRHWIYWLGPFSGSAVFSVIYRIIFRDRIEDEDVK